MSQLPSCTLLTTGSYPSLQACTSSSVCGWSYKCTPAGACVLAADGAYATQPACFAECRPSTQARSRVRLHYHGVRAATCALSSTGTYESQQSCMQNSSCGGKFKCVNDTCVRAPDGTFDTLDECFKNFCGR